MTRYKIIVFSFFGFFNLICASESFPVNQPSVIFVQPEKYSLIKSFEAQIEKTSFAELPFPDVPYAFSFSLSGKYLIDNGTYLICGTEERSNDYQNLFKDTTNKYFRISTAEKRTLINGVVEQYIVLRLVQ